MALAVAVDDLLDGVLALQPRLDLLLGADDAGPPLALFQQETRVSCVAMGLHFGGRVTCSGLWRLRERTSVLPKSDSGLDERADFDADFDADLAATAAASPSSVAFSARFLRFSRTCAAPHRRRRQSQLDGWNR